ncbi:DUF2975 domain-containing protein [Pontibacter burrus]|uniref:DUF2975 domain-containing protein n=1 Tax=Pontibacter burrus TaxID=2704466 RepID=A0A6B3LV08_9BACT|nr:DUF2975 domain-containing protein [Pontibacter burrus]NEM98096.1 DUF2975 domain-containing protein [Pontibacter burrus]
MEKHTKTQTQTILTIMHVLAWIVFIGLLIKTGAILFTFIFSYFKPTVAQDLYRGLDLYDLRQASFYNYSLHYSFIVALSAMKAYIAYLVIQTLSKVNLQNPFTAEVAGRVAAISYVLLGSWIVLQLSSAHSKWLAKSTGELLSSGNGGEYLFIAGLVFIIAQIFKRGVEIQSEQELTV